MMDSILLQALKKSQKLFFAQTIVEGIFSAFVGIMTFAFFTTDESTILTVIWALGFVILICSTIDIFRKGLMYLKPTRNPIFNTLETAPELIKGIEVKGQSLGTGYDHRISLFFLLFRERIAKLVVYLNNGEKHRIFIPLSFLDQVLGLIKSKTPNVRIDKTHLSSILNGYGH